MAALTLTTANTRVAATSDEHLFAIWSTDGGKVNRSLSTVAGIPLRLAEQGLDVGIRVLSLALEAPEPSGRLAVGHRPR